jgi:hypothetical protein
VQLIVETAAEGASKSTLVTHPPLQRAQAVEIQTLAWQVLSAGPEPLRAAQNWIQYLVQLNCLQRFNRIALLLQCLNALVTRLAAWRASPLDPYE